MYILYIDLKTRKHRIVKPGTPKFHSEVRIGNLHKYQDAERIVKEMTGQ
jgi:hypothetical protein